MATTLNTSPVSPVEGDTVILSVTGSDNDTFVFEVTSVPPETTLSLGFLLSTDLDTNAQAAVADSAQVVIDAEDDQGAIGDRFVADRGGEYGINVWEFRNFGGSAASFPGDPVADPRNDLKLLTSFTVDVGVLIELPMITSKGEGATLELKVNGDTIRAAAFVDILTERSRLATLETTTVAALAAIVGSTVTAIGNDLVTATNDFLEKFNPHRILLINGADVVHIATDDINIPTLPPAHDQQSAIALLNEMRDKYLAHATEGQVTGASKDWHVIGEEDTLNLPLAAGATSVASATVLLSDLRERCYERHRLHSATAAVFNDPDVHEDGIDDINVLTANTLLDDVVVAFFDAIDDTAPTAATGESQGAQDAANRYGFTRSA